MNIFRILLLAACLTWMLPAYAADDDLTSSAYLVFDPETGEFVTVQDPDRTMQDHAAQDPAIDLTTSSSAVSPAATDVALAIALIGVAVWLQLRKSKAS